MTTAISDMRMRWLLASIAAILAISLFVPRLWMLSTRRFDPDELEHAHVAWSVARGDVPYRDFFEMHPPLFHVLAAVAIRSCGLDSADAALRCLVNIRIAMWCLSVAVLVLTAILAARTRGREVAWLTLPILAGDIVLLHRGIEIRPDTLAALFWLTTLIAIVEAIRVGPDGLRARISLGISGAAIGLAVMTSQKLLLAGPGLAVTMLWYAADRRFGGTASRRFTNVFWQLTGCGVVWALVLSYFSALHATGPFLRSVLLQDLAWKPEAYAGDVLRFISRFDPWLFALAAGGVLTLLSEGLADTASKRASGVLLLNAASVFLGLFLTPVPYPQYGLTFIPLFAIFGASLIASWADSLAPARDLDGLSSAPRALRLLALPVFAWLAYVGLSVANPVVINPFLYPIVIFGAAFLLLLLPIHGRRAVALSVVSLALAVFPAQWTRWALEEGDGGQFVQLRYVLSSPLDAVVLDGWSGLGVFRPHAWYYWMLHSGVRAMLTKTTVRSLEDGLSTGAIRPQIVVLDSNLRQLSTVVTRFVESHYRRTGVGEIYTLTESKGP